MLLESAIGDAYGAPFEFALKVKFKNDLSTYNRHPRFGEETYGTKEGEYTDDTQMSIAVAEVLVSGMPLTATSFTKKFVECFKRDQRAGYAKGFYNFLLSINNAEEFSQKIANNSIRNGAIMRVGPIGLFASEQDVIKYAGIQSAITHNHPSPIIASQAIALMYHYFAYDLGTPDQVGIYIKRVLPKVNWDEEFLEKTPIEALGAASVCISLCKRHNKLSELLKHAVDLGGDTDTAASICLGAASLSRHYKKDLPNVLYDTLENGSYGTSYIIELDKRLLDFYNEQVSR